MNLGGLLRRIGPAWIAVMALYALSGAISPAM